MVINLNSSGTFPHFPTIIQCQKCQSNVKQYVRYLEVNTCYLPHTQSKYMEYNKCYLKHLQCINTEVSALWKSSREGSSIDSEERNLKEHQNARLLTKYKYNPI